MSGPFLKVDCTTLPESLIENELGADGPKSHSDEWLNRCIPATLVGVTRGRLHPNELFGHERGAYTGADQKAPGKFDMAAGGTIFIDEIGELPLSVQGKFLRVLQDREFQRVGGAYTVTTNVRVVAATNRDLKELVAEGLFRADLFYRIKVVELRLPPLRARGADDIALLAHHFVVEAAGRHGRLLPAISAAALQRLTSYNWPGNVRELENCLESAVVIMDGTELLPEHLSLPECETSGTTFDNISAAARRA